MNRLRVSFHSYVHYVKIKYVGEINMKKLLLILVILLIPSSVFARNPFSFLKRNGNKYRSICSTLPASSPVTITLSEIDYESEKTTIKKGYYTDTVETKPARILIRHAVKNNSKKTITACYFHIKVLYNSGILSGTLYEGNIPRMECNIRPRKKLVETIREQYNSSNNSHELIKKGFADDVSKIICKVYFVKYSDGTSEGFNPDL